MPPGLLEPPDVLTADIPSGGKNIYFRILYVDF
jgi:hypothetical protein